MWIYTRHGFCSARKSDSDDRLIVRFRTADHAAHFSRLCGNAEVIVTSHTDYRYRIVVSKDGFSAAINAEIDGIDYPNFKASVEDRAYKAALGRTWAIHYDLQDADFLAKETRT